MDRERAAIIDRLRTLRRRIVINDLLKWAGIALTGAAICILLLTLTATALKFERIDWKWSLFSLAFCSTLVAVSFLKIPTWPKTAAMADRLLGLPDTILSALQFSNSRQPSLCERIQIRECLAALETSQSILLIPLDAYRLLSVVAGGLCCIAAGYFSLSVPHAAVDTTPIVAAERRQRIADTLENHLPELERSLVESSFDPSQLVTNLKQQIKQLRSDGDDASNALAALSRMRQSLSGSQQQLNQRSIGDHLRSLGEALESIDGQQASGQLMQRGNFKDAAQALRAGDSPTMNREQRLEAADRLRSVSEAMSQAELDELSEAVAGLADALEKRDKVVLRNQLEAIADALQRESKLGVAQEMIAAQQELILSQKDEIRRYMATARAERDRPSETTETREDEQRNLAADGSGKASGSASEFLANGTGLGGSGAGTAVSSEVLSDQPAPLSLKTERQLERIRGLMAERGTSEIEQVLSTGQGNKAESPSSSVDSGSQKLSTTAAVRDQVPGRYNNVVRRYFQTIHEDLNSAR